MFILLNAPLLVRRCSGPPSPAAEVLISDVACSFFITSMILPPLCVEPFWHPGHRACAPPPRRGAGGNLETRITNCGGVSGRYGKGSRAHEAERGALGCGGSPPMAGPRMPPFPGHATLPRKSSCAGRAGPHPLSRVLGADLLLAAPHQLFAVDVQDLPL